MFRVRLGHPRSRIRDIHKPVDRLGRGLVVGFAVVAYSVLSPLSATASTSDGHTPVSWSVQPADADGKADHRSWVELALAPGETVREHMLVTNLGSETTTFRLSAADGYFTETGRFNMLPADQPSTEAGTWITLPDSASIAPGESRSIPFTVSVPTTATPGDHAAGVAAGVLTGGGTVGVESRIGFRVMTRVTGDLAPALAATTEATYHPSWNPFAPGTLEVRATISDTGNTRLDPQGSVTVSGPAGLASTTTPLEGFSELAPGESRSTTLSVDGVWPLFLTSVTLDVMAAPVVDDGETGPTSSSATATTATIPWSQLALALLALLLGFLWVLDHRRRRRAFQQQLERAREEGRRHGRSSYALWVSLVVLATHVIVGAPTAVDAATAGVGVEVEITPQPAVPSPVPPTAPSADVVLPLTGGTISPLVAAAALGLILLGVGIVGVRARSRKRAVDHLTSGPR